MISQAAAVADRAGSEYDRAVAYAFARIRSEGRSWQSTYRVVSADDFAALAPARPWGAFSGLFGVGSDELILVTSGGDREVARSVDALAGIDGVRVVQSLILEPTVRPTRDDPLTREGLYVFRFFDVAHRDVDEVARLSSEAWKTFETSDAYAAEPQALWAQSDRTGDRGSMLLLTWYDGLGSWQASRRPAAGVGSFRRRGELTRSTIAYATRLISG